MATSPCSSLCLSGTMRQCAGSNAFACHYKTVGKACLMGNLLHVSACLSAIVLADWFLAKKKEESIKDGKENSIESHL